MLIKDDLPMIAEAEANIRADFRHGRISKEQFQKELLIMSRSRAQIENPIFFGIDFGEGDTATECKCEQLPDGTIKVLDIRELPKTN